MGRGWKNCEVHYRNILYCTEEIGGRIRMLKALLVRDPMEVRITVERACIISENTIIITRRMLLEMEYVTGNWEKRQGVFFFF